MIFDPFLRRLRRFKLGIGLALATVPIMAALWLLAPELGGDWGMLTGQIRLWQMDLQRSLAGAVRAVRDDGWLAAGPLAGVSFLYGVAHAAGPGHGKAVIGAYVLADGRRLRRGLLIAWAAAMAQAITAVALIGGAVWVLGWTARDAQAGAMWLERAGYALIGVIGLVMLWRGVLRLRRKAPLQDAVHIPDHGGPCGHAVPGYDHSRCCGWSVRNTLKLDFDAQPDFAPPRPQSPATITGDWRGAAMLIISVGLRPCSGALLALTFAATMGVYGAGVLAAFAMAVGTAVTVSVLAALAAGSRRLALAAAGDDLRWLGWIEGGLVLLAGLALAVMGGLFLAGSFAPIPAGPFR